MLDFKKKFQALTGRCSQAIYSVCMHLIASGKSLKNLDKTIKRRKRRNDSHHLASRDRYRLRIEYGIRATTNSRYSRIERNQVFKNFLCLPG